MNAHRLRSLIVGLVCLSSVLTVTVSPARGSPANQAAGTTIQVNSSRDEVNENGRCSLREAILAANRDERVDSCPAGNGVDTIRLPGGGFYMRIEGSGENEGLTGDLDISESVNIQGAGSDITEINYSFDYHDRYFHILSPSVTVQISDVRISGGRLTVEEGAPDPEPGGGAIYNLGTLQLTNVVFFLNRADGINVPGIMGGAIYNAGSLTINNGTFDRNLAGERGGAISNHGEMVLDTVTFTGNHGGAIENAVNSQASIDNSVFEENGRWFEDESLQRVGAIEQAGQMEIRGSSFVRNKGREVGVISNSGSLLIEDSSMTSNSSDEGPSAIEQQNGELVILRTKVQYNVGGFDGGGLVIDDAESVWVEQSQFIGNSNYHGGGIRHKNGPTTIFNTTISNNSAYNGGGLEINGQDVRIIGSTISGNNADEEGGGIFSRGSFTIENSTVTGNTAWIAGGIFLGGQNTSIVHTTITRNRSSGIETGYAYTGATQIRSSIIAENYSNEEEPMLRDCISAAGELVSLGWNLVGTTGECGWTPAAGDLLGSDSQPLDAGLEPLRNNGGLTLTHALLPTSPALDAADTQNCPETDQRGILRPQGDACDIGSFEREEPQPVLENTLYLPIIHR